MEYFFFDIETCGEYPDFKTLEISDSLGAKLFEKKFEKMDWSQKWSIEEAYLENAGIISTFGKICCISFGFIDQNGRNKISSFSGTDEKYIVESFNNLLKKIESKNFTLNGYRINYFDIPWLLHKLHKWEIKPADIILPYGKKPWDLRVSDLSDDWRGKFAWNSSFDEVCYELGLESPKLDLDGSLVHKKYWCGEIDSIREYCERDVNSCIEVAKKLFSLP